MENHDQAYHVWREEGIRDHLLIHIDAHHDMYWMNAAESLTIANYICPALLDGLVREVHWVVPDPSWDQPSSRRAILRHLKDLIRQYPGPRQAIDLDGDRISTTVLAKPFTIYPLRALLPIEEAVLLDIDIDFLVIPHVSYETAGQHSSLPWCWPEDLAGRLHAAGIQARCATIAYSVEGGFTPLKWKYLGMEVASRLTGRADALTLQGLARMRQGAQAAEVGQLQIAEEGYQVASKLLPGSAAPCYHLAHLHLQQGRIAEARVQYQRALDLDRTYRTPYGHSGLLYHSVRQFERAKQEHHRMLQLDPLNPYAHFGLGLLAIRHKQWHEAEEWLKKALALDNRFTDGYRSLGDVLVKQGRVEDAIAAYERSLKLALEGQKPLHEPIATLVRQAHFLDPEHGLIHARLARLYEIQGAMKEAINGYRMGIAGDYDTLWVRGRLARLYLKQGQRKEAIRELRQGLALIPKVWKRAVRRMFTRTRQLWR